MSSLSLQEHIARSRQAVEANKAKGNRHAELLSSLYADTSRFLEELIQNTEDAYRLIPSSTKEKKITFRLFTNRLEIYHNGKPFDEDDLKSITTFASTTKSGNNEINLIGKFGIGFKSVFAICSEPCIYSGKYSYKITDFEILTEIPPQQIAGNGTCIVLPFKNSGSSTYRIVEKGLKQLKAQHLLFLEELNCIEILMPDKKPASIRKTTIQNQPEFSIFAFSYDGLRTPDEEFIVMKTPAISVKGKIALAFLLENNSEKYAIRSVEDTNLFSWFPTLQESGLKFYVHAPFTTTPTREHIPFDKSVVPENVQLAGEIKKLFTSSLHVLRDNGFLSAKWMSVMPLEKVSHPGSAVNSDILYKLLHQAFINALQQKKLLPYGDDKFCKATEACIISDDELAALCDQKGMQQLFGFRFRLNNKCWQTFPDVKAFLETTMTMREISVENFAFRLAVNHDFMQKQKPKWFIGLYHLLTKYPRLWDEAHASEYYSLRHKEIILAKDNTLKCAFDPQGVPKIFPKIKTGFKVHLAIRRDAGAIKFIDTLCENHSSISQTEKVIWIADVSPETAVLNVSEFSGSNSELTATDRMQSMFTSDLIRETIVGSAGMPETHNKIHEWAVTYAALALPDKTGSPSTTNCPDGIDLCIETSGKEMRYFQVLAKPLGQQDYIAEPAFVQAIFKMMIEGKGELLSWIFVQAAGSTATRAIIVKNPLKLIAEGKIIFNAPDIKFHDI